MFASVSEMAACMTWKAVWDLPVLYRRIRAEGRPAYCCYSVLLILLWFERFVVGCFGWSLVCFVPCKWGSCSQVSGGHHWSHTGCS